MYEQLISGLMIRTLDFVFAFAFALSRVCARVCARGLRRGSAIWLRSFRAREVVANVSLWIRNAVAPGLCPVEFGSTAERTDANGGGGVEILV